MNVSLRGSLLFLVLGILWAGIHLTGCTDVSSPTEPIQQAVGTTADSLARPSEQAAPTSTSTPRPTPTASPTPTHTALPPALTNDEALAFVVNMQETNGGCELPCWWSITPGETTGKATRQMLSPLRRSMEAFIGYLGGTEARYTLQHKEYNHIFIELLMSDEKQAVEEIWLSSFIPDDDPSTRYHESWRRYFLNELLARQGIPSQVWLGFGPHTGDGDERPLESIPYYYELIIMYSDLGLIASYAGPAIQGDLDRACVTLEELKELRLFIRTRSAGPLIGPPFEAFTGEPKTSLQEATGLSLETFHETFKNLDSNVCLEESK